MIMYSLINAVVFIATLSSLGDWGGGIGGIGCVGASSLAHVKGNAVEDKPGQGNRVRGSKVFYSESEYLDPSSRANFQEQVFIASNTSNGLAVGEDEEVLPFDIPEIPINAIANFVDEGVNIVTRTVGDAIETAGEAVMTFVSVFDGGIGAIFELITGRIYENFALHEWNLIVTNIIAEGLDGNRFMTRVSDIVEPIKRAWGDVQNVVETLKTCLEPFGALDSVLRLIQGQGRSGELSITRDVARSLPDEAQFIQVDNDSGKSGFVSAKDEAFLGNFGGLGELKNLLSGGTPSNIIENLKNHMIELRGIFDGSTLPSTAMNDVLADIESLLRECGNGFREFLANADNLGSIQFLLTGGIPMVAGVEFECGLSIDAQAILYFLDNNHWDQSSFTQIMSFHVGYAINAAGVTPQTGFDFGFAVAYHTSRPTGTNGYGWGFSLDGVSGVGQAAGLAVGWSIPGSHLCNQFVAQLMGAGFKLQASAFMNHAIILAYYDTVLGFISAAPSIEMARYSGNPRLYYSKFSWAELGTTALFNPSIQTYFQNLGYTAATWNPVGSNRLSGYSFYSWSDLSSSQQEAAKNVGFDSSSWDAPSIEKVPWKMQAANQWSNVRNGVDPMMYWQAYYWADILDFEKDQLVCLGWNEEMFNSDHVIPDTWSAPWSSLSSELQVCATVLGYNEHNWAIKRVSGAIPCGAEPGYWYRPAPMAGTSHIDGSSPSECQQRCQDTEGCNYFNFYPTLNNRCVLSTGAEGRARSSYDNAVSGSRYCSNACADEPGYYYRPAPMAGTSIIYHSTVSDCQRRCRDTPGCIFFNFYPSLSRCYLSTGEQGRTRSSYNTVVAGTPYCSHAGIRRCGPRHNGNRCDCMNDHKYCDEARGMCGNGQSYFDAQASSRYDCPFPHSYSARTPFHQIGTGCVLLGYDRLHFARATFSNINSLSSCRFDICPNRGNQDEIVGFEYNSRQRQCVCRYRVGYITSSRAGQGNCPSDARNCGTSGGNNRNVAYAFRHYRGVDYRDWVCYMKDW